jgi:NADH-quinone oxidoreductase subunit A
VTQYLPIFTMLVLAVVFAGVSVVGFGLLSPRRPTAAKDAPYECGIVPTREPVQRFPVRFYLVAMIFIIFDIEIIFLYPWAVIFRPNASLFLLVEMAVFAIAVFVSFVYLISNGALDWGPVQAPRQTTTAPGRTTESTVRRVSVDAGEAA